MSSHPLDRSFKAKLGNGNANVPDGMWDAIETQLPRPSSPRRAWLIGLLGLAVLSIATAFGWSQFASNEGNATPMVNNAIVLAEENPANLEGQETTSAATSQNNQNSELATPVTNETKEDSDDDIDVGDGQNTALASADRSGHSSLGIGTFAKSILEPKSGKAADPTELDIGDNEVLEISPVKEDEIAFKTEAPSVRPSLMLQFAENTESLLTHSYDVDGAVTDCYNFGKTSHGTFVLELFTGPTYSLKSMDSRDEDVSGYITGRDSTEKGQISWHAGLRVGYEHVSGLTAKAGIQYAMVNELFQQVSRTSGIRIDSIFDSMGNLVRVDSTLVEGERVKQTQNRYHSIDIPLIVGYRIDNGNWDFGIEAGPIFNISYKAKGDMISATGEPFSFSDESDPNYQPVFNTSLGIGLFAGVYASKRVADKLWLFVEPNVHHRFKSVTRDDFAIDQRQTNISLSLGLRYKL